MTATPVQVTIDCADPAAQAEFWTAALGYVLQPPPPPFTSWVEALDAWGVPQDQRNSRSAVVDPAGVGPRLFFQEVPEAKSAKNRVHLDLRKAPGLEGEVRMNVLEAEADRLVAVGATRVSRCDPDPDRSEMGFVVMQDPEGNEFCLD